MRPFATVDTGATHDRTGLSSTSTVQAPHWASPQQVRALYADLAIKLRDGVLKAPIEATYPIEDIKQALTHAQRGGRNGKVLVLPNGRLGAS